MLSNGLVPRTGSFRRECMETRHKSGIPPPHGPHDCDVMDLVQELDLEKKAVDDSAKISSHCSRHVRSPNPSDSTAKSSRPGKDSVAFKRLASLALMKALLQELRMSGWSWSRASCSYKPMLA